MKDQLNSFKNQSTSSKMYIRFCRFASLNSLLFFFFFFSPISTSKQQEQLSAKVTAGLQ